MNNRQTLRLIEAAEDAISEIESDNSLVSSSKIAFQLEGVAPSYKNASTSDKFYLVVLVTTDLESLEDLEAL